MLATLNGKLRHHLPLLDFVQLLRNANVPLELVAKLVALQKAIVVGVRISLAVEVLLLLLLLLLLLMLLLFTSGMAAATLGGARVPCRWLAPKFAAVTTVA